MIVTRLSIVETIVSQAMFDTILLEIALTSGWARTLQATSRLTLGLLTQIAHLNDAEVALALLVGQHRHLHFWLDWLIGHNIEEIWSTLLQFQTAGHFFHILTHQVGMDRTSTKLALSYTLNDGLSTH